MTDQKQDPLDDDDDFDELDDELDADVEAQRSGTPAPRGSGRAEPVERRRRFGGRARSAPDPASTPSEVAVHVGDKWSTYFVAGAVVIFLLIFLNGMLLGTGGLLRPIVTPTPILTPVPTVRPSATLRPSATPAASPSGAPSAAPSGTPSPAPSSAPSGQ